MTVASKVSTGTEVPVFYLADEHDHAEGGSTMYGLWIYLMSDCLIFASFFMVYAVLGGQYAYGPLAGELFSLNTAAINTVIMLMSSLTCGITLLETRKGNVKAAQLWLAITGVLGLCFLISQYTEYTHIMEHKNVLPLSAFLSSFLTLVFTHGLHVIVGLIWAFTLIIQVSQHGLIQANRRRLVCFNMFWNFLDILWVCVFTCVYLMGMLR